MLRRQFFGLLAAVMVVPARLLCVPELPLSIVELIVIRRQEAMDSFIQHIEDTNWGPIHA